MSTLADLIRELRAKREGDSWRARCPAHDDRNPSLNIRDSNGKILVHCHAGCDQRDVINALKDRGLWGASRGEKNASSRRTITRTRTANSYQIVRLHPKDFKQRRPDGHGDWIWKHPQQVLYRLPEVLGAPIVFVVEGEKDAETLRSHGFVATTNAGGAKAAWLHEYTETLRGREVFLIPDNDEPGWMRVDAIAGALLGNAKHIGILFLPAAKDVTDWFVAGHSECELIAMLEDVNAV